jgi:hypothetical protein
LLGKQGNSIYFWLKRREGKEHKDWKAVPLKVKLLRGVFPSLTAVLKLFSIKTDLPFGEK